MNSRRKLDEIRWRLDNRTAMYHGAGTTSDSTAHDDMEWMYGKLKSLSDLEESLNGVIDTLERNT